LPSSKWNSRGAFRFFSASGFESSAAIPQGDVSINDGIDERWPEITPALVTARLLAKRATSCFSGKLGPQENQRAHLLLRHRAIVRRRESPKRKVRRRAVNQQKDNADDYEPADEFHLQSDQL
jgi:hypothetical protein